MDFHKKTRSADFLLELLEQRFQVTKCYAEEPYSAFAEVAGQYDVLVCFQVMPPLAEINRHFAFTHAVFFPMADSCPRLSKIEKWYPFKNFQIISFSKILARNLQKAGFSAHAIQFFPKPRDVVEWGDDDAAYFWNRVEDINLKTVEKLFDRSAVRRVHVHKVLDPDYRFIQPSEKSRIKFTYSTWYEHKSDMIAGMMKCAFYIAPRPREGIGMSFLEAMAMGRCVIAPDNVTMNEYIIHGENGFLYDLKNPPALSIKDVQSIQRRTHDFMCKGYEQWEQEKGKIFEWMVSPVEIVRYKIALRMLARFLRKPVKILRLLKNRA